MEVYRYAISPSDLENSSFFSPPRPVSGMLKMIVKSKFDGKINIFIVLYISTLSKLNTSNQKWVQSSMSKSESPYQPTTSLRINTVTWITYRYLNWIAFRMFSEEFLKILKSAKSVVAITGAGISAESGVPTFRGAGGLWRKYEGNTSNKCLYSIG